MSGRPDYYDHFLNLIPAVIMPHYHGWFKFEKPEILREAKNSKYPVYALSDQSALKVTTKSSNFTLETVGEDYYMALGELGDKVNGALDNAADALGKASTAISKFFQK